MDVRALTSGRPSGRSFTQAVVSGYVSLNQPAPAAFSDPLFVVIPSTSASVRIDVWPQLHGATLPTRGAGVTLAYNEKGTPNVVDWDGVYTVGSGGGSGSTLLQVVAVNASTTLAAGDNVALVTSSAPVQLSASPVSGRMHTIKDAGGTARTTPIVVTASGGALIDGASSVSIDTAWAAISFITNGTNWYRI